MSEARNVFKSMRNWIRGKKGEGSLSNEVKMVGGFAIIVAIVLAIVVGVRNTFTTGTAEYNSTNSFVTALGTYATYGTIIVLLGLGVYLMRRLSKF